MIEGYKTTDIGEIPESWRMVKSSEVFELIHGYQFRDYDFTENGFKIIKIGQIKPNGKIDLSNCSFFSEEREHEFRSNKIFNGDVLMALTGATLGKSCLVDGLTEAVYQNYRVGKFEPIDENVLSKKYLYFLIGSELILNQIFSKVNFGAQGNIGKSDFVKLNIPLPKIKEQIKIAEIFASIDEKIEIIESKINQTQKLKKGLMQEFLSKGIEHTKFKDSPLGEMPENWDVIKLENHIELINGYPFESIKFNETGDGTKLLRGINITTGKVRWEQKLDRYWDNDFDEHEKYSLKAGDLVISMDGSLVGRNYARINKIDLPLLLVQRVACIRAKNTLVLDFLHHIIGSPLFINYVDAVKTSSGIPHISAKNIKEFQIPFPPKQEQQKIADILTTVDEKLDVLQAKYDRFKDLKKGLMQQLLTGKIRVKINNHDRE